MYKRIEIKKKKSQLAEEKGRIEEIYWEGGTEKEEKVTVNEVKVWTGYPCLNCVKKALWYEIQVCLN